MFTHHVVDTIYHIPDILYHILYTFLGSLLPFTNYVVLGSCWAPLLQDPEVCGGYSTNSEPQFSYKPLEAREGVPSLPNKP